MMFLRKVFLLPAQASLANSVDARSAKDLNYRPQSFASRDVPTLGGGCRTLEAW